jgi:hypothetical protein
MRLDARIGFDVLRRAGAALGVPAVVIVVARRVGDALGEIARVKGHAVAPLDRVDRQPPVELALRRRVPGVAVRVESIGDARGQIVPRHRRAHPRHVEIRILGIAAELAEQLLDELLRAWVMNERRLEARQARDAFLHRQDVIDMARIVRRERLLDHRRAMGAKRRGGWPRPIDENRAGIESGAPLVVVEIRLKEDVRHRFNPRATSGSVRRSADVARFVPTRRLRDGSNGTAPTGSFQAGAGTLRLARNAHPG